MSAASRPVDPSAEGGSEDLPEDTPFALVGSSSLYKRESYPNGKVPEGKVTAVYAGGNDPWKGLDALTSHGNGMPLNWHNQGADAGLYTNEDIHAVRILAMEPTTDRNRGPRPGKLFHSHANERLRVLGELPVRKVGPDGKPPVDPDGNPDTSFLAKIPADVAFTFQTLDRDGMVLNMAQTWHQLRPGEVRTDCGGCHAHSQEPTPFEKTAAAQPDYKVWDLTEKRPILAGRGEVRYEKEVKSVEYHRDVWPIFQRSCIACHTTKGGKPAGNLALDGPDEEHQGAAFPAGYYRLAVDKRGKYGHKPVGYDSWGYPQTSRYVRALQSRRSLLIWKVYGKRLDGFHNDDHPSETEPGSGRLSWKGKEVDAKRFAPRMDIDYVGSAMPPAEAVKAGKVKPLSDEDRRTLVRWIDLGCPLDLDYDARRPDRRGHGFACDDQRPTLALTYPAPGRNDELSRIVVGMHDYGSGLDERTFRVHADFAVNGVEANTNLAGRFKAVRPGTWELRLDRPIRELKSGVLVVSIKDQQGNLTRIERSFSVRDAAKENAEAIRKAATFYASFDKELRGDFGGGTLTPSTRYPKPKEKGKFTVEKGLPGQALRIAKDKGIAGGALDCTAVLPRGGRPFFPAKGNLAYRKGGWGGSASVWVKTDADGMIKSRFCDPLQITDKNYNDGAIWFDFNDKKPRRDLRMGIFTALTAGKKAVGEDDPKAPLVWVRQVGWKADEWHHVVMTWRNFDTGKADAQAALYIDGKRVGVVKDQAIAMNWDVDEARVFFALGYVGLLDELALFNRELTEAEVKLLHKTPGLLAGLKK